ncbi:MAG TPA: DUF6268 family outer membrane beta-barrel protein [Caulifigura sp.]|jgi:hypothetical protein|nr:DUF6268 family outer membrane beta-barrel protein [Caulifigura sp.]
MKSCRHLRTRLHCLIWNGLFALATAGSCVAAEPPDTAIDETRPPELFAALRPEDAFEESTGSEADAEDRTRPAPLRKRSGGSGRPGGDPPGYSLTWSPSQSVSRGDGDLSVLRQSLSAAAPVWTGDGEALMFSVGVRNLHFDGDVTLPDSGTAFPDELWNINFGLNYRRQFENGWSGMLMTGFGSASDDPFRSADVLNGMIGGSVVIPARNERDAWNLGAIYLPTGALNFPLPIVAYRWNPSDVFQMNVGVPFSMTWRPTPEWNVNLTYAPVTNVNARASYQVSESVAVFAAYENQTDSYLLADRERSRDRFFAMEQRLVSGCEWRFTQWLTGNVNAGYAFGRRFGEGENQGDDLRDKITIDAGPFAGLQLLLTF